MPLLALLCAGPFVAARAQTDPGQSQTYNLSAVGLTRGQLARLSVVFADLPPGPCVPAADLPPGPCTPPGSFRMSLNFTDELGNVVAERAFTVSLGRSATLVYAPSSFRADGRAVTRASVRVEPQAGYLPRIVPTVDVSDIATGQISIVNPGWLAGFNPQPEPPGDFHFGLLNVVRGQTTRVNVSNLGDADLPPGPCRADVTFYDGGGQVVGRETLWLAPGQTGMADFATTDMPAGWRGRIRAAVHVESTDGRSLPVVAPSLEVFAADTGRSVLFHPGALMGQR
ncbi:MAG: hypothetical protein ABW250_05920 [Pyrinomonadaceae bacterium]